MSEEKIVNSVTSQTTHVYGRTLNSARTHHFIIDGTRNPKEEVTPVEVFLSAVSACCVQWVEQFAKEEAVPLHRLEVSIEGSRFADRPTEFDAINVIVRAEGPTHEQLEDFVNRFQQRCPLYRTVSKAVEVGFSVRADSMA